MRTFILTALLAFTGFAHAANTTRIADVSFWAKSSMVTGTCLTGKTIAAALENYARHCEIGIAAVTFNRLNFRDDLQIVVPRVFSDSTQTSTAIFVYSANYCTRNGGNFTGDQPFPLPDILFDQPYSESCDTAPSQGGGPLP